MRQVSIGPALTLLTGAWFLNACQADFPGPPRSTAETAAPSGAARERRGHLSLLARFYMNGKGPGLTPRMRGSAFGESPSGASSGQDQVTVDPIDPSPPPSPSPAPEGAPDPDFPDLVADMMVRPTPPGDLVPDVDTDVDPSPDTIVGDDTEEGMGALGAAGPNVNYPFGWDGLYFRDNANIVEPPSCTSYHLTPPDTNVAVGPNHVVQAVNQQVAVFDKLNGAKLAQWSFKQLFTRPPGSCFFIIQSDPVVVYDELANRFVIVALADNFAWPYSYLDIAVSNTSNPLQGWNELHRISTLETTGCGYRFGDYPKLGFNADSIVVTLNMYQDCPPLQNSAHAKVLAFQKASLLDANPATLTYYVSNPSAVPEHFTMAAATMHGSVPGDPMWFVEAPRGEQLPPTGDNTLRVVKMTNVLNPNPVFTNYTIGVPTYYMPPAAAEPLWLQPGGRMETNDARALRASRSSSGRLVATQEVGSGGGAHARWYEINTLPATPTLTQWGEIDRGAGVATYFPAIDIAPNGTLALSFMESSSNEFVSIYGTGRTLGDPPGTMRRPFLVRAGQANFNAFDGGPQNGYLYRAGDYSGAAVDATTGMIWVANEFAGPSQDATSLYGQNPEDSTNWFTFFGRFNAPDYSNLTQNQKFVYNVYGDLLQRTPERAGFDFWNSVLASTSRAAAARSIAYSYEAQRKLVQTWYERYFYQPADPGGLDYWAGFLQRGGLDEQVEATIVAADLYYNRSWAHDPSATTTDLRNRDWIKQLYLDFLHRPADAGGLNFWAGQLAVGMPRYNVAYSIRRNYPEGLQTFVKDCYQRYLRRPADPGGLNAWVNALQAGYRDEDVRAGFVSSAEYDGRL